MKIHKNPKGNKKIDKTLFEIYFRNMTGPKKYKIGILIAIFMVSIVVVTTVVLALTLYILSKELNSAACEILLHMLVCKFYHLPLLQILVRKFLFLLSNKKFHGSIGHGGIQTYFR